ncbi:MAG TPA: adenosine deaminase [Chthoniobacteraceae bacterium]|jgi:adenosine deaminase|nr:adenosine deaminase [Chthoniobacteraceae bacterium]
MPIDLQTLPKVLLHEHLDGGLRPQTVIDLARDCAYDGLPTDDAAALGVWFHRGANRGSLPLYLEGFAHTIAVMQTRAALERVAFEFIEDMHADGVVYAEVRFAPCFHREHGLTDEAIVQAVIDGLQRGREKYRVEWGIIVCALRDRTDSLEAAELAIDFRSRGVVGFDLAGEEAGYPPKKHVEAFRAIQQANFYSTLHAGEAFGVASIWQALQLCGAHRLGHATRLTDDMTIVDGKIVKLGTLAQYILDRRIPLEMCLSSNVHTGSVRSMGEHPFKLYFDRGFRVTINTDDRLMSDTTMTREFQIAVEEFGLKFADLEKITINSIKSAFIPFDDRIRLIYDVIKPGYAKLRGAGADDW